MLKIQDINTRVAIQVKNTGYHEGTPFVFAKSLPTKWAEKYPMFRLTGKILASGSYNKYELEFIGNGWELLDAEKPKRAPRAPKAEPQATEAPTTQEQEQEQPRDVEPKPEAKPATKPEAKPKEGTPNVDAVGQAIADALRKYQPQGNVDVEQVRDIAREVAREVVSEMQPQTKVVKIQVNNATPKELPNGEEPHPLLQTVLTMVANDRVTGRFPWLYGPAGSGKSTLAKQVADALGLPFYSVSSLQQKYELEGYTDAVGKLVETSFYKAFKDGGVFNFDEASCTTPEVQVAFNTACAQLIYNFPKDGMVKAHKDFHIIAADNSMGRGGDSKYSARYKMDVSTLDRYLFVEVDYTDAHDLRMANGDKELVTFIRAMRKALDDANTEYLATPRASKAIKALQAVGFSDHDALWYGLCSGWNKQDLRTIAAHVKGSGKWFDVFKKFINA